MNTNTDNKSDDIRITDKCNTYIIKLDSLETKLQIFKNKNKLFDTNLYIGKQAINSQYT